MSPHDGEEGGIDIALRIVVHQNEITQDVAVYQDLSTSACGVSTGRLQVWIVVDGEVSGESE